MSAFVGRVLGFFLAILINAAIVWFFLDGIARFGFDFWQLIGISGLLTLIIMQIQARQ